MIELVKDTGYIPHLLRLCEKIDYWRDIDKTQLLWYLNSMVTSEHTLVLIDDKRTGFAIFEIQVPVVEPVVNTVVIYTGGNNVRLLKEFVSKAVEWGQSLGIKRLYGRVLKNPKGWERVAGVKREGYTVYKEI